MRTYLLHGLRVRSEVELDGPTASSEDCDLEIRRGAPRPVPDAVPDGRLLARLELPVGSSSLASRATGFTLRVHGYCDFELDPDLRVMRVHSATGADDAFASIVIGGAIATALTLRGSCVLHASAVESDGEAVAFVGGSGMGKTTIAALCCAAGARLVSDDVLRVEVEDARGWCFGGSSELRLRAGAASLAGSLDGTTRRSTVDERVAVRPPRRSSAPRLPLRAVVAPERADGEPEVRLERLRGAEAARELIRFPRTLGWLDADVARRDLGVLADLTRVARVYRAHVPWTAGVRADLGERILSGIVTDVHGDRASVGVA